jgi:hypothetical protein
VAALNIVCIESTHQQCGVNNEQLHHVTYLPNRFILAQLGNRLVEANFLSRLGYKQMSMLDVT